ncbi:MAG TPA: serine hydrolase domain-containing protein [Rhizomicrobium sp.]|nr:serine hydrolase domain-containing protein [Rhizomicrobium sp.]
MKTLLALVLVLVAAPALAQTQAAAPSPAQAGHTGAGATFSIPSGWSEHASGSVIVLDPPESDTHLVIVDIAQAQDARSAVASAWKLYRGGETHAFKLLTTQPARNGWEEQANVSYETSPNEHLVNMAMVRRKGTGWTVVVLDGSESTFEKRAGPVNLILQSLRPAGYSKENFSGKHAHPFDPAQVQALLDFAKQAAAELHVPGVGIALIDHGKIVYEGGVGARETGKPEPVDAHTRFMIASNTKGMSTLLLARLVDQGKLKWDEPAMQVYPAFRLGSPDTTKQVLMRHLVCACTGVPRKDYEWLFTGTDKTPPSTTFSLLAATEPTSKFGEVFQYSNLMASAAGYIGGHIVHPDRELGAAYDAAMQEMIFDPLAMHDTTFSMDKALAADHASPHADDIDGKIHVIGMDINRAIAPFRPAGGAWSSPHDLILYVQNELTQGVLPNGRRLVSSENLLARRARGVATGEDQWYGMGLWEDATWGVSVIHHGGDLPGFHSDIFAIPSAQVGAVILTNADNGAAMRRPFMRRMLELMYDGRPEAAADVTSVAQRIEAQRATERKRLIVPAAPADAAALAAIYVNPDLGNLAIEKSGGKVVMHAAAWGSEVATRHNDDGTVSLITIDPQNTGLEFVIGSKGGKQMLTTRDGQHVYELVEAAN